MQHTCVTQKGAAAVRHGYAYIARSPLPSAVRNRAAALELSRRYLFPKLGDPDYLAQRARRELLTAWFEQLPPATESLCVLDVGGRLQPYRPLLKRREALYVAIDPVFEGLIDVAGVGERLPFGNASFDLVICTQVLNYATSPSELIAEIQRVLKPGGTLYLSAPAIFPAMHDHHWSFAPDGLRTLLRNTAVQNNRNPTDAPLI
jgi:SAM-dependent methyltransferase